MIDAIRDTTVLLSEMMRNVLFDEGEINAAWVSGPPVRFVFCGSPYCELWNCENQLKVQWES